MRVAVTGASGFLGSTVCRQLVARGDDVVAFVRSGSSHPALEAVEVMRVEGDVRDAASVRRAIRGCDVVVHTAFIGRYQASAATQVQEVNGSGTRLLLEGCVAESVRRVVVVDTISAFRASRRFAVRDADFDSRVAAPWLFPYLRSKIEACDAVRAHRDRVDVTVLHCAPMYGAGDKHGHTGGLIRYLTHARPWAAPPGGTSVIAASDAAAACVKAARLGGNRDYVIAAQHLSWRGIYNSILRELGARRRIRRILPRMLLAPAFASSVLLDRCGGDSWFCPYVVRNGFHYRVFSSRRARAALAWRPNKRFAEAVAEQVAWMRRHGSLEVSTSGSR